MARVFCVLLGYGFGCLLTAEAVVYRRIGHGCAGLGSGNPGMANVMTELGFWPGVAVLAGDTGKTATACLLCRLLFGTVLPWHTLALYAGLGAALGHNFPFWRHFRGGKGVAVTCMAVMLASPLWGIPSAVAGMLVVFATGWLPLGAVVIPCAYFAAACAVYGAEDGAVAAALALLMLLRNLPGLRRIRAGTERRRAQLFRRHTPRDKQP